MQEIVRRIQALEQRVTEEAVRSDRQQKQFEVVQHVIKSVVHHIQAHEPVPSVSRLYEAAEDNETIMPNKGSGKGKKGQKGKTDQREDRYQPYYGPRGDSKGKGKSNGKGKVDDKHDDADAPHPAARWSSRVGGWLIKSGEWLGEDLLADDATVWDAELDSWIIREWTGV